MIKQHDNARPHIANLIKHAIEEVSWKELQHPSYSPNLAPSDYHFFIVYSNNVRSASFNNDVEFKTWNEKVIGKWFTIFLYSRIL